MGRVDRVVVAMLGVLVGCYRPQLEAACMVACDQDQTCPDGLRCGADQRCHADGTVECSLQDAGNAMTACVTPTLLDGFGQVCGPVRTSVELTGSIDTDSDGRCIPYEQTGGGSACVIIAVNVSLTGAISATGSHALALIAMDTLEVMPNAGIDVASHSATVGAGANGSLCTANPGADDPAGIGGGGGAGGAFHGAGGSGGSGNALGAAGTGPLGQPRVLRGGCPGSPGGSDGSTTGLGGNSGGAVYLLAGTSITIDGTVNASGAGAHAATSPAGGAGGGAGGMIALEAPLITGSGIVFALGGGGGGGSVSGATSFAGQDPIGGHPGFGGGSVVFDDSTSGAGGNGSSPADPNGQPGTNATTAMLSPPGGGGGGGASGFILTSTTPQGTVTFAPSPTTVP